MHSTPSPIQRPPHPLPPTFLNCHQKRHPGWTLAQGDVIISKSTLIPRECVAGSGWSLWIIHDRQVMVRKENAKRFQMRREFVDGKCPLQKISVSSIVQTANLSSRFLVFLSLLVVNVIVFMREILVKGKSIRWMSSDNESRC
jgi:hypothetical protein